MGKPDKIFRDPLYDYISIDREHDAWLIELLDCPEVQRLRRIHQLGVSYLTYPGADHNRLAHSLGVLHLMQNALRHLERLQPHTQVQPAKDRLLASCLLHDAGHGPFSHLFEPCLGIDHEVWSKRIVLDSESKANSVLRKRDTYLPQMVADLIEKDNKEAVGCLGLRTLFLIDAAFLQLIHHLPKENWNLNIMNGKKPSTRLFRNMDINQPNAIVCAIPLRVNTIGLTSPRKRVMSKAPETQ
jgi:hypothetical protein